MAAKQADPGIPWWRRCRSCKLARHGRSKDRLCPPCRERKRAVDGTIEGKIRSAMDNAMAMQRKAEKRGDTILADMLSAAIGRMASFLAQLRVNP